MKNQKNLQRNPLAHLVILISSVSFAFVYHLFTNENFDKTQFIGLCCIIFFDFEVAFFVIQWFKKLRIKNARWIDETNAVSKVVFTNIFGLLTFFVIFIAANTIGTIVFVIILHHINGWEFPVKKLVKLYIALTIRRSIAIVTS